MSRMSSDDQKALLKKVYAKNKGRIMGKQTIPAPVGMQVKRKPGETTKQYQARMAKFVEEDKAKRNKAAFKTFQKELSAGSDKKLAGIRKKNTPPGGYGRMRAGKPKPEKKKTTLA